MSSVINQLSAGVAFREVDTTTIVPSVSTSQGAFGGFFNWGPVHERVLIAAEPNLVNRFGPPTNNNYETWLTLSSFLAYGSSSYVVRAGNTTSTNGQIGLLSAFANVGAVANVLAAVVKNQSDYNDVHYGTFDPSLMYVAKYPGSMGDSLRISVCDSANAYQSNLIVNNAVATGNLTISPGSNVATLTVGQSGSGVANDASALSANIAGGLAVGDRIYVGNSAIGTQFVQVMAVGAPATVGNNVVVSIQLEEPYRFATPYSTQTIQRFWEFSSLIPGAPGQSQFVATFGNTAAQDELHVVVVDDGGKFTGVPGQVLEKFQNLSRASDARNVDGTGNWYVSVINQNSQYVWWANDRTQNFSNTALNVTSPGTSSVLDMTFQGGADGASETNAAPSDIAAAYSLYQNVEDVTVDLVMNGKSIGGVTGEQNGNWLVDNIVASRMDCTVFVSPNLEAVVSNRGEELTSVVNFFQQSRASSYVVRDSGYKYMYDKYNNVYRWVPLNGDTAGLCARTDRTNAAFWSPAGFNRGQILNYVKLAYNPGKADRNILYPAPNSINPVCSFPGVGAVLYGDKTGTAKPSAFDRINVRRLFLMLERAITAASQYTLFEFNDSFTQANFRNMVTPYLRSIQGARGITLFLVVCDGTNNTAQVVDADQFIGDIYIVPARSINFITLNFVAVNDGVAFSEVEGSF